MLAIDTAPTYGLGRAERIVGQAIHGRPSRPLLMTKAGLRWEGDGGPPAPARAGSTGGRRRIYRNSRPESLRAEVEHSLKRLQVEAIDLLQLHWPDPRTPIAETMGALLELRREGKIREIGVSNTRSRC
jgi:aryl-alcohol dehydrogenase-like predicted oxidoreductase